MCLLLGFPTAGGFDPTKTNRHARNVLLSWDAHGSMGWNLQDLLNIPRTIDAHDQYFGSDGEAMVQNYTACKKKCMTADGQPVDLAHAAAYFGNRNLTAVPYGTKPGDYYMKR